jgi:hypothetical protein
MEGRVGKAARLKQRTDEREDAFLFAPHGVMENCFIFWQSWHNRCSGDGL